MKSIKWWALGFACAVALGCGGSGGALGEGSGSYGSYKLQENAVWLDDSDNVKVVSQTADGMTLSGLPRGLSPGDVLVSTQGDGALRKVVSLTRQGSQAILKTEPASVGEAFSEMDIKAESFFNPETLGPPPQGEPGLTMEWLPATRNGDRPLRLTFDKYRSSGGMLLTGTLDVSMNPSIDWDLVDDPDSIFPTLVGHALLQPSITGSLAVSAEYAGSVSGGVQTKEFKLGRALFGPVLVVPSVQISASFDGSVTASVTSSFTAGLGGTIGFRRGADRAFVGVAEINPPQATARVLDAQGQVTMNLIPFEIEAEIQAWDLIGVEGTFGLNVDASGTLGTDSQNRYGVQVDIGGKAFASAEFEAELGVLRRFFDDDDIEIPLGSWESNRLQLFSQFFPITNQSSVDVRDNGNVADDIFRVALNGVVLGNTVKGGAGQFPINNLRPGEHTLTVTCIEDDAPPGTLAIRLANGLTFSGGGTSVSDTLDLGASRSYTIIVPDPSRRTTEPFPPVPAARVTEHP